MDGIANHFPAKNALHCRILHIYNLTIFSEDDIPEPRKSAFGAWTQTSASLASVSTVLVLRIDHCLLAGI